MIAVICTNAHTFAVETNKNNYNYEKVFSIKFTSLLACFTFANDLSAQEDFATISQGTGRLHVTTNDNRPRSLFPDSIECSYYAGELSFSSEIEYIFKLQRAIFKDAHAPCQRQNADLHDLAQHIRSLQPFI